jgi:hypothetical protein
MSSASISFKPNLLDQGCCGPGIRICGNAVESFPDPQMRFPVIANKFPVRLKNFPVPSLREFAKIIEQCQLVTGKFEAR